MASKSTRTFDVGQVPELMHRYLRDLRWAPLFSSKSLAHAEILALTVRLVDYQLLRSRGVARFKVDSQTTIGTHYRVEIGVDFVTRRMSFLCSCPVAYQCKHAAACALSIAAGVHLERWTDAEPEQQEQAKPNANASVSPIDAEQLAAERNLRDWEAWQYRNQHLLVASSTEPVAFERPSGRPVYVLVPKGRRLSVRMFLDPPESEPGQSQRRTAKPMLAMAYGRVDRDAVARARLPEHEIAMMWRIGNQLVGYQDGDLIPLSGTEGDGVLTDLLRLHVCRLAADGPPLRVGTTRTLHAAWQSEGNGTRRLRAQLDPPADLVSVGGLWYLDRETNELGPVAGIDPAQLALIESLPPVHHRNDELISAVLHGIPLSRTLPSPGRAETVEVTGPPKVRMRLAQVPDPLNRARPEWIGHLWFQYGSLEVPDDGRTRSVLPGDETRPTQIVVRDTTAERKCRLIANDSGCVPADPGLAIHAARALASPFPWRPGPKSGYPLAEGAALWLGRSGRLAACGIELVLPPELERDVIRVDAALIDAKVREAPQPGWFELDLGVDLDGKRISLLPVLARAFHEFDVSREADPNESADARMLLPLDRGQHISLPMTEIRRLCRPIVEWLEHLDARVLNVPVARADLLTDLADAHVTLHGPETLNRVASALRGAWHSEHPPEPEGLSGSLRPYQHAGMTWLDYLSDHGLGGLLADDMGLGKTLQILAHVLAEHRKYRLKGTQRRPTLVVMPTSLVPNWQAEAARFAPALSVLVLHGGLRHENFPHIEKADLVLTTYALLPRDIELLRACPFSLVVFDEAQALKNVLTRGATSARALVADRKVAMTGTPIENHLGELWAVLDLVVPGLLGPQKEFTRRFRTPIEKHGDAEKLELLNRRIKPFVLRRTKSEVAAELPSKTMIPTRIALEGRQRELYESLRLAMHDKVRTAISKRGLGASSIVVLDALLKLRQACCDPALVKLPAARRIPGSAKRELLRNMVSEMTTEGRRILVFSQFTEMLDLIEADMIEDGIAYTRLDGSTKDRATPVAQFQEGLASVMLISLKAGGTGLNLTAADTVIHYDPWWNPAAMRQAEDRAHRIGQDKPVFVYALICEDTVEDRILELQEKKSELARAILEGGSADAMRFDEETLNALFAAPRT